MSWMLPASPAGRRQIVWRLALELRRRELFDVASQIRVRKEADEKQPVVTGHGRVRHPTGDGQQVARGHVGTPAVLPCDAGTGDDVDHLAGVWMAVRGAWSGRDAHDAHAAVVDQARRERVRGTAATQAGELQR
jgi:hypothetical protein